jgi:hypothetical protein
VDGCGTISHVHSAINRFSAWLARSKCMYLSYETYQGLRDALRNRGNARFLHRHANFKKLSGWPPIVTLVIRLTINRISVTIRGCLRRRVFGDLLTLQSSSGASGQDLGKRRQTKHPLTNSTLILRLNIFIRSNSKDPRTVARSYQIDSLMTIILRDRPYWGAK